MIRSLRHVLLGGLVLVAANSAQAGLIVSSTFDTTSEGWTGVYLPGSAFSSPAPFQAYFPLSPSVPQPVFDGTVGNPPSGVGSLRYDDSSNNTWTFMKAPASYSGDMTNYAVSGGSENIIGGSLKFDFRIDDTSTMPPVLGPYYGALFYSDMNTVDTSDDITLIKELTLPAVSGSFFTHTIDIPTDGAAPGFGWHKDYFNNADGITAAEFDAVFSDLDGTFINAHWRNANVITYFDNISFNGVFTPTPPDPIPEPSSLVLLLTAGIPALVAYRRRKAQRVA